VTYCFDTSAFIHAAVRAYPFKNMPSFWKSVEGLVAKGQLVCPRAVLKEIEKKDDELHAWFKKQPSAMILDHDAGIQAVVTQIMGHAVHSKLVDVNRDRSGADPFVIATAVSKNLVIVTQEDYGKASTPKIPNVADALGVKHMKIVDVMIQEGWVI
jgi:hypothetical protein